MACSYAVCRDAYGGGAPAQLEDGMGSMRLSGTALAPTALR